MTTTPQNRLRILTTDGAWITTTPDDGDSKDAAEFFRFMFTSDENSDAVFQFPTATGNVVIRMRNIERVHIEEHEPGLGDAP